MNTDIKRCTRCVLPDTTPGIVFDKSGVCNYCTCEKIKFRGEPELLQILEMHRDSEKKYECIVNISGGRDSAYTLLKLKKDYGLKVLALNYANPFTAVQARKNIANMVQALNVDFIRFSHKSRIFESCFRQNLIAWCRNPAPAMVPMMCIGCKIIWKDILRIARQYNITLIINGGNPYEYTSFKKELLAISSDEELKSTYYKYAKGLIREVASNISYILPKYLPTLIKGYFFNNQYSLGSRILGRKIDRLDLFHFLPWKEDTVISRIENELGWEYPHAYHSTWRFDCKIGHFKDYMYMKTLGMTEKDDFYAKMVREGLMTRSAALARLEKENQLHIDTIAEIIEQLGLSPKYFLT